MSEPFPRSIAEFTDQIHTHHETHDERLYRALPDELAHRIVHIREAIHTDIGFSWPDLSVFFGEQAYGPGPQKVLGKRLLGHAARAYAGVSTLELMATHDIVGSEPDLRTFVLPNVQSSEGMLNINLLPGWRKVASRACAAVMSPEPAQLDSLRTSVRNMYGKGATESLLDRLDTVYRRHPHNYGDANTEFLRDYETSLGIEGDHLVHDGPLDSLIAQRGGLEVLLALWPRFVTAAHEQAVTGVRVPKESEAPFYLYHDECGGRMSVASQFIAGTSAMDTPLHIDCMHCAHHEKLTAADVVEQKRTLTFRAMARVAAYSLFRVADGQITGGGSIYNHPTQAAMAHMGLPYWPLMHMARTDVRGETTGIFDYTSAAAFKKGALKMKGFEPMTEAVRYGKVSMADLEISIQTDRVRQAIDEAMEHPGAFGPHSRIVIPARGAQHHG